MYAEWVTHRRIDKTVVFFYPFCLETHRPASHASSSIDTHTYIRGSFNIRAYIQPYVRRQRVHDRRRPFHPCPLLLSCQLPSRLTMLSSLAAVRVRRRSVRHITRSNDYEDAKRYLIGIIQYW